MTKRQKQDLAYELTDAFNKAFAAASDLDKAMGTTMHRDVDQTRRECQTKIEAAGIVQF